MINLYFNNTQQIISFIRDFEFSNWSVENVEMYTEEKDSEITIEHTNDIIEGKNVALNYILGDITKFYNLYKNKNLVLSLKIGMPNNFKNKIDKNNLFKNINLNIYSSKNVSFINISFVENDINNINTNIIKALHVYIYKIYNKYKNY